ncbi:hypothetical protein Pelo_18203 [Pelomyxa schiedti]|nr:hypothetical protein Pelo_18203 [Pelomyxa schiedti]
MSSTTWYDTTSDTASYATKWVWNPCDHIEVSSNMWTAVVIDPRPVMVFLVASSIHFIITVMAAATNKRVGAATMVVDDTSAVRGGTTYTGRVVGGKPEGRGTLKWPDGDTYDGVWLNGDRTGRGVYKWHDGSTYEGEWLDYKMDGWGVAHLADGPWFEGLWRDDHLKRGTWHDSNGVDVWDGEWVWNATANCPETQGWGVQRRAVKGGGHRSNGHGV